MRGENLRFFFFLLISGFFWLILKLNQEVSHEVTLPLEIIVPDEYLLSSLPPAKLTVKVEGDIIDINSLDGRIINIDLSKQEERTVDYNELKNKVEALAHGDLNIQSIEPISISLGLVKKSKKKVPIIVDYELIPKEDFFIIKNPEVYPDSAEIIGNPAGLRLTREVYTAKLILNDLTKDKTVKARIIPFDSSLTISPLTCQVRFEVDQYIEKTINLKINELVDSSRFVPNSITIKSNIPMRHFEETDLSYFDISIQALGEEGRHLLHIQPLKKYIKNVRISKDTLYAVMPE